MNPERIIAGLDIGSAKTTVVIAEAVGDRKNTPTLKILGVGGDGLADDGCRLRGTDVQSGDDVLRIH